MKWRLSHFRECILQLINNSPISTEILVIFVVNCDYIYEHSSLLKIKKSEGEEWIKEKKKENVKVRVKAIYSVLRKKVSGTIMPPASLESPHHHSPPTNLCRPKQLLIPLIQLFNFWYQPFILFLFSNLRSSFTFIRLKMGLPLT